MEANKIEIKIVEKEIFDAFQEKHKDDIAATFDGTPIDFHNTLWGVFENGELKSIMTVYASEEKTFLLTDAYTAPEARKKGYFSLLVKRFMSAAELIGFKIHANAFEDTSYPILKKLGFTHRSGKKLIGLEFISHLPNVANA